jgi:putative hemolysin
MYLIAFIFLIFFMALSMFFSGMETGVISIDRLKLEQEAKEDKRKRKVLAFIQEPNRYLGVTLIGNNIAVVVVTTIFTIYFADQLPLSNTVKTLLLAGVMLIFAEIIPKSLFRDHAYKFVNSSFPTILFFYAVFKPFISMIDVVSSLLVKLFNIEYTSQYNFLTREDLAIILSESKLDDSIEQPQRDMLEEVMDFNLLTAKNVMTPRLDIVAIKNDASVEEIIDLAQKEGYSRYPVYGHDLDHIIGILIIYDLIKQNLNTDRKASDFIREGLFVPETIDLNSLLQEMQTKRKSLAIVVDSFGGTAGLITIEDILEELVGEIEDEYDDEEEAENSIEVVSDNHFIAKGDIEIDYLNDIYSTELPEGDYETLAGLIIDQLKKIPGKGQLLVVAGWQLKVLQTTPTKILKVEMSRVARE